MRALIDTCIIVDALQSRTPYDKDAQTIFLLSANKRFDGFLTVKAVTDIYYLTRRQMHSDKDARSILTKLLTLFRLIDTTSVDVQNAIAANISDFEDAVMMESATRSDMDGIVTRNIKDFKDTCVPIYTPSDFIRLLAESTEDTSD